MAISLKPLAEQVLLITGATSGIGLATLRMAIQNGAKVFMVARNEDELQELQDEMRANNFHTAYAVADVSEQDQLQVAAEHCLATFGRIDTWINNAGESLYARLLETEDFDARRVFDTNFWGVIHGCKVAAEVMSKQGGAIINIGSVLSEASFPIQGIYLASKQAVKSYTDSLRRELQAAKIPLSVSLIMPAAIDTPQTLHAESYIGGAVHVAPVYHPEVVAKMILKCAETPIRELGVGSSSFIYPWLNRHLPKLHDKLAMRKLVKTLKASSLSDSSATARVIEGELSGNYTGHVMKSSLMTEMALGKRAKNALFASVIGIVTSLIYLKRKNYF